MYSTAYQSQLLPLHEKPPALNFQTNTIPDHYYLVSVHYYPNPFMSTAELNQNLPLVTLLSHFYFFFVNEMLFNSGSPTTELLPNQERKKKKGITCVVSVCVSLGLFNLPVIVDLILGKNKKHELVLNSNKTYLLHSYGTEILPYQKRDKLDAEPFEFQVS